MNQLKKRSLIALIAVVCILLPAIRTFGFDYANPYQEGSRNYEFTSEDTNSQVVNSLYFSEGYDVPASFSLRDKLEIKVDDQGSYNYCALFAITKSLETNYALTHGEYIALSERYTSYLSSKYLYGFTDPGWVWGGDGFDFYMAPAYFGLFGVPTEADVPWTDLSDEDIKKLKDVKTAVRCTATVTFPNLLMLTEEELIYWNKAIKKHVMKYGSVVVAVSSPSGENFNYDTNAAYFTRDMIDEGGHAVSIVGWDDNYPKENFSVQPKHNGAYLCLNSWGSEWGDGGYFWLSYEDENSLQLLGIISSEKIDDSTETTIYTNGEKLDWPSGCLLMEEPCIGIKFDTKQPGEYLYEIVLGASYCEEYCEENINLSEGGALNVFLNPVDDSFDRDKLVLLCTIEGNTMDNYIVLLEEPYQIAGESFSIVLEFVYGTGYPNLLDNVNNNGEELESVLYTAESLDSEWYRANVNFPIFVMTGPEHLSSTVVRPSPTDTPLLQPTPQPTAQPTQTPEAEEKNMSRTLYIALGGFIVISIIIAMFGIRSAKSGR